MIEIRAYKDSDFDLISNWWKEYGETAPVPGMMTGEGTLVLELDQEPVMTLSLLMPQIKEMSFFEGYCAKPGIPKNVRNALGNLLFQHGYQQLKQQGFKRVIIFTYQKRLADRYCKLGMTPIMAGVYVSGRTL